VDYGKYTLVDHSYNRTLSPAPFIIGTIISGRQVASSYETSVNTFNYGEIGDPPGNKYTRQVNVSGGVVTVDNVVDDVTE